MADLGLSGLASGFDWKSVVSQLTDIERAPQRRLRTEQSSLNRRNELLGSLSSLLTTLQERSKVLKESSFFDSRLAKSSDTATSATAASATAAGNYKFEFYQLATVAAQSGGAGVGASVNATATLTSAGFAITPTTGNFTINGTQIAVDPSTDTLNAVISRINSTVSGVTASLSADRLTLSSASAITLGSGTDTSNFLAASRLSNNGTGTLTSTSKLGGLNLVGTLSAANFATAPASPGSFMVNGVTISYTSASTVSDIISAINNSAATVTASYDSVNDRFTLTNKTEGDIGIALQDVTGDFLAKAKLTTATGGALARGKNLLYSLNGGGVLSGQSNTVTASSHGITGLSVAATKANSGSKVSSINTSTNVITSTESHGYATGDVVTLHTTGTAPGGVSASTPYYVRALSSTSYSLHTSESGAIANTGMVSLSSAGSGDQYFLGTKPVTSTITISADTEKIKKAITDFVDAANKVHSMIESNTASTTDSAGKVTQGLLASDRMTAEVASHLRSKIGASVSALSGTIKRLESLGYTSSGYNNQLTLGNSATLDSAISSSIADVKTLFTDTTGGLGVTMNSYLSSVIQDTSGSLVTQRSNMTKQSTSIDTQIAELEKRVQANSERLTASFIAMEQAQAKTNQQMQYLAKRFA
jgi:flagellar hook-associated protein 2